MKRALILCCLTLCLCGAARAQSPPAEPLPPDIVVEKYAWSRDRSPGPPATFTPPLETLQEVRASIREDRRGAGVPGAPRPRERRARHEPIPVAAPRAAPAVYSYRLTVRNNGAKAVREVDWDYVFLSAETGEELGRNQFTSTEKVRPGKQKELTILTHEPPTRKVGARDLGRGERAGLAERVILVRVLYEDGTVWRPNN